MKIMLTGGAGFIGSHIADLIIKEGHQVTIDNFQNGKKLTLTPGIFYHLDIRIKVEEVLLRKSLTF
jgi:UDP-glucose 4-epimerase